MLYSEFINGTGCRDTEQNYNIYKGLELVYMSTEISKNDIYKLGKRLVNNELKESQKVHNAQIANEMQQLMQEISNMQSWLDITPWGETESIKYYEREIKSHKQKIKQLKSLIIK